MGRVPENPEDGAIVTITIRPATLDDVAWCKAIASRYRDELGQVMWPALREAVNRGELTVACHSSTPIAFVNWHTRRDGWTTVYEIAVMPNLRRQGIGQQLLDAVPRPTRLKCTVDNANANAFYAKMGFTLTGVEDGRKRQLNVWEHQNG